MNTRFFDRLETRRTTRYEFWESSTRELYTSQETLWSGVDTQAEWRERIATGVPASHVRVRCGDVCVVDEDMTLSTAPFLHEILIILLDKRRRRLVVAMVDTPDVRVDPVRARHVPMAFVDLALPQMSRVLGDGGEDLSVFLLGGGCHSGEDELFNPGRRIQEMTTRRLDHMGLRVAAHDLSGHQSRCVVGGFKSGRFTVTYEDGTSVSLQTSELGK